jgi:dipeptidyl aminopeptidase/acylaminoacyl peptidase
MHKAILSSVVLFSSLTISQTPAAPPFITDPAKIKSKDKLDLQPMSVEKLYVTHRIGGSTWSPDGKQIAFISNMSGRQNIWVVSAERGWPWQLTFSNQSQVSPAWSPKGRWIAYGSDSDGNGQSDIFLVSATNGQIINLTNTPEVSEEVFLWSPDGDRLAYSVKPKAAPNYEVDVIEILTKKITHITRDTPKYLNNFPAAWSADGTSVIFNQQDAAGKNRNIFLANATTGQATNLTAHQGEHSFAASDISPDGKTILLTSNSLNGYDNAALLDVATKKITWLTQDKWEMSSGKFSPDGKRLTWTTNTDGNGDIVVYDMATRQSRTLPMAKGINSLAGSGSPFTQDGAHLLFAHEGANSPNDLWVFDFASQKDFAEQKAHPVTYSLSGGLNAEDMVEPFLVHYPSKDGKWQVSAFVYVPYNAEKNSKNAAVVFIRGGPSSQSVNNFNRIVQYLVNQGFFVIAPNYRGSSGSGKDFMDANLHDLGGGDLDDVVSAADWLVKTGYVDTKKIAVMGASYGGYLSMMAVTKAPDRFAAGVPMIPFVNWFTEIENADPALREYFSATMGDPVKDKARLQERSPINFVDQIKVPLLLLAGGNDPLCPKTEAEQVAWAVKKRGGVVELKVYENEGHGFAKVENQIDAVTRVAEFLKKYVPPESVGALFTSRQVGK